MGQGRCCMGHEASHVKVRTLSDDAWLPAPAQALAAATKPIEPSQLDDSFRITPPVFEVLEAAVPTREIFGSTSSQLGPTDQRAEDPCGQPASADSISVAALSDQALGDARGALADSVEIRFDQSAIQKSERRDSAPSVRLPRKGILNKRPKYALSKPAPASPSLKKSVCFRDGEPEIFDIPSHVGIEDEKTSRQGRQHCLACLPCFRPRLSRRAIKELTAFFKTFDIDGSAEISLEEATGFWASGFTRLNAKAMFEEVDSDQNGTITLKEFLDFWRRVSYKGYTEEEILREVRNILEGGAWVEWKNQKVVTSPASELQAPMPLSPERSPSAKLVKAGSVRLITTRSSVQMEYAKRSSATED